MQQKMACRFHTHYSRLPWLHLGQRKNPRKMKQLVKGNLRRFLTICFNIRKKDLKPPQLWLLSQQYYTSSPSEHISDSRRDPISPRVKPLGCTPVPQGHTDGVAPLRGFPRHVGVSSCSLKALWITWKQKAFLIFLIVGTQNNHRWAR